VSLLPWADWQFYAVTAVAAGGAWLILKPLLARRGKGAASAACSSCTFGGETTPPEPSNLVQLGRHVPR
jgi:hypothetical protein